MRKILVALAMLFVSLSLFAQLLPKTNIDIRLIDKIGKAMSADERIAEITKFISGMGLRPISSDDMNVQRFSNYRDFDKSYINHPDAICAIISSKDGRDHTNSFSLLFFDRDAFSNLLSQLDESDTYRYEGSWADNESIELEFSVLGNGPGRSSLNLKEFRSGLCSVMYVRWRE